MDQLKTFLDFVKKQHFWILCGLAVLVGVGIFLGAKSKLLKVYEDQKSKIKSLADGLGPLTAGSGNPNQNWINDVSGKTKDFRETVYKSWVHLYEQQKQGVFVWPQGLGPEFVKDFGSEPSKESGPINVSKMGDYGPLYQTYITATILPAMAKIIDAKWVALDESGAADSGRSGGRPRIPAAVEGAIEADQHDYKVIWDAADQTQMKDNYSWSDPPTEAQVRCAQEEMWVLDAVFRSIGRANSDAKGSFDASVRQIAEVKIAYDATNRYPLGEGEGRIQIARAAAAPDAGSGQGMGGGAEAAGAPPGFEPHRPYSKQGGGDSGREYSSPRRGGRSGRSGGRGGRDAAPTPTPDAPPTDTPAAPVDPLNNGRYVNANGKPLLAADLQSPTLPPEYRLMAFKLRLVVDESQIQKVVEEFANSVLPLEVREVRINVTSDVNEPAGRGGRRKADSLPTSGAGGVVHNATLEIRGVAYLMNPPDRVKLGLPAATEPPAGGAAAATDSAVAPKPAAIAPTDVATTTGATAPTAAVAAPQTTGTTDATPPAK
ncbi:MAG TPA: hypothetical protein VG056_07690 [Pirellulales bacterium]|nr:hypothetical protein [Pirellulales bacterium]